MTDPEPQSEHVARVALGGDLLIPLLACALAAYYFGSTLDLVWEAKATGIVIGTVLVALCAGQFVRIGRRIATGTGSLGFGDLTAWSTFNQQRFAMIALAALFIIAIPWIGTTLGLFVLLIVSMLLLGVRSIRALIGVAAVTAALVHLLLITLLNSRLPQGVLEKFSSVVSGGG